MKHSVLLSLVIITCGLYAASARASCEETLAQINNDISNNSGMQTYPWEKISWLEAKLGTAKKSLNADNRNEYTWHCGDSDDNYIKVVTNKYNLVMEVDGEHSSMSGAALFSKQFPVTDDSRPAQPKPPAFHKVIIPHKTPVKPVVISKPVMPRPVVIKPLILPKPIVPPHITVKPAKPKVTRPMTVKPVVKQKASVSPVVMTPAKPSNVNITPAVMTPAKTLNVNVSPVVMKPAKTQNVNVPLTVMTPSKPSNVNVPLTVMTPTKTLNVNVSPAVMTPSKPSNVNVPLTVMTPTKTLNVNVSPAVMTPAKPSNVNVPLTVMTAAKPSNVNVPLTVTTPAKTANVNIPPVVVAAPAMTSNATTPAPVANTLSPTASPTPAAPVKSTVTEVKGSLAPDDEKQAMADAISNFKRWFNLQVTEASIADAASTLLSTFYSNLKSCTPGTYKYPIMNAFYGTRTMADQNKLEPYAQYGVTTITGFSDGKCQITLGNEKSAVLSRCSFPQASLDFLYEKEFASGKGTKYTSMDELKHFSDIMSSECK